MDFLVIAITSPDAYPFESEIITRILREKRAEYVHIRKPDWDFKKTAGLIDKIPFDLHPQLKIHDNFSLIEKFNLGGVHLNMRNSKCQYQGISKSKSCHNFEELKGCNDFEYVTLSPVFDSISKPGYLSKFDLNLLQNEIKDKRVIALGGVTPQKFDILKQYGFFGGAMLGYFFPEIK